VGEYSKQSPAPTSLAAAVPDEAVVAGGCLSFQPKPAGKTVPPRLCDLDKTQRSPFVAIKAYRATRQLLKVNSTQPPFFYQLVFESFDADGSRPQQTSKLVNRQERMSADEVQQLLAPARWSTPRARGLCSAISRHTS